MDQNKDIKIDLKNPEFLKYMEGVWVNCNDYANIQEAKQISIELSRILDSTDLKSADQNLYKSYQDLALKFQFLAMPVLSPGQVLDLFTNHFLFGLSIQDFSLKRALDSFLLTFSYELDMFEFLDQLEKSILENQTIIGNDKLDIGGTTKIATVASWISLFNRESTVLERGALEEATFISKNKNTQKLSENEKSILKKVINFYDWLKFPKEESEYEGPPELEKDFFAIAKNASKIVEEIVAGERGTVPKPVVEPSSRTVMAVRNPVAIPKPVPPPVFTHGQDLDVLKKRIEGVVATKSVQTAEEIKREISAKELPAPQISKIPVPTSTPAPKVEKPRGQAPLVSGISTLDQIKTMDDLKKISIENLRQGQLVSQIQLIKSKISSIAAANRMWPYYAVAAFEQSPLFVAYLQEGTSKIGQGSKDSDLTKEELKP